VKVTTVRALRALDLREREGAGQDGGVFRYYGPKQKLSMTFRWDGAGITKDGQTVVIEEEKPPFSQIHIQGHLARIRLMSDYGEKVKKLIWLVPSGTHVDLDRIVLPWVTISEKATKRRFPKMEYRNYAGRYLGELGSSEMGEVNSKNG
jgi:hypothetical protein